MHLKLNLFVFSSVVLVFAMQVSRSADQPTTTVNEKVDKVTSGHSVRASKVIGMEVRNGKGEKIGKVHDLVFDRIPLRSAMQRYHLADSLDWEISYLRFLGLN